jgi:hypothetical protein
MMATRISLPTVSYTFTNDLFVEGGLGLPVRTSVLTHERFQQHVVVLYILLTTDEHGLQAGQLLVGPHQLL